MTDPQLTNNNSSNNNSNTNNNNNNTNNNNNNNNDGEPKYLHKKFKKMATTEAPTPLVERKKETLNDTTGASSEAPKKGHVIKDTVKESSKAEASPESEGEPTSESRKTGYVCPYCKLSCAKPSVLQKHIRAHTNERPYPCVPCGFAFKTKSNLYKHCRSRAHALKMGGGDASKVSEDSDISLSDSASNGTGTPPPAPIATTTTTMPVTGLNDSSSSCPKVVKTGKIYKPKFHTALQSVTNELETTSSNSSWSNGSSGAAAPTTSTIASTVAGNAKRNVEQLQEHIDKIITDNRAIVEAVDPRLHKLMQRQQSLVETKSNEQPLNLSSLDDASTRKRCYSDSFAQENRPKNPEGSIIKDLLLKSRTTSGNVEKSAPPPPEGENFVCQSCKISYSSLDNLEAHRRYYCKGSPKRIDFQLDLEKRDDFDKSSDFYGTIQPLPSPGPLLGNTRLVDAYSTPVSKKSRPESVPTTLRSLEELSKYPRPNSLQMFGGQVRILDNSGETRTMRIEPRNTNSPLNESILETNKSITTETSSIVVRSGLHSGGTILHKPPGTPAGSMTNSSISLANAPQIMPPIIPNISAPNLAPTMSCYPHYLEPHLNPLTSITAYNPLTLPQPGIASILHAGKVIPYVPGMPGPQTLTASGNMEITPTGVVSSNCDSSMPSSYKIIPGLPGLHAISQPLDLASPGRALTPGISGIPGPTSSNGSVGQPLDLANPGKLQTVVNSLKTSTDELESGGFSRIRSPKVSSVFQTIADSFSSSATTTTITVANSDKYRFPTSSVSPTTEFAKAELDRRMKNNAVSKFNLGPSTSDNISRDKKEFFTHETNTKVSDVVMTSMSVIENSHGKRLSPKGISETRKRAWNVAELENPANLTDSPKKFETWSEKWLSAPQENPPMRVDSSPPLIITNTDCPSTKADKFDSAELKVENELKEEETSTKFLRPSSLPLKPGTFTPKRHHGITPTANTLPLISPETPRPKKSYGQLYLNGHAYTYLGLKCSTRVFYCTLNRPQPMYVSQQHGLSMYSNWKICKEAPPDLDMAHYDSRHRPADYTIAWKKQDDVLTHSSQRPTTPSTPDSGLESDTQEKARRVKIFDGGFESNEDYTYVRGRGRGRYVCEECGIRCKKPSMLKKHIRTHTDVRPYTCKHCSFSFKTKGNLTKHMKSKAHYKKCVELGVMPVPTSVCDENIDKEAIARLVAGGGNADDSTEDEEDSDGEESDESGSEEQEAAQSLLSLSQPSSNRLPGLLPVGRPSTYPYTLTFPVVTGVTTSIVCSTSSVSVTTTAVIQNEMSNRCCYFPSSRSSVSEEIRESVIRSSKSEESEIEAKDRPSLAVDTTSQQSSQPMDLTTRQTSQITAPLIAAQRPKPADILTPVSEQLLMQTIVQSMERLPVQGREWKPEEADGQMLQAYLTERHVMDSRMKQQYRVGCAKSDKQPIKESYPKHVESMNSRFTDLNTGGGTQTVTYTNPSRLQQNMVRLRQQTSEDVKMEMREKIYLNNERRPFDIESLHIEDKNSSLGSSKPQELALVAEGNRIGNPSPMMNDIDRSSMFNAMKMMREIESPPRHDYVRSHDIRARESSVEPRCPENGTAVDATDIAPQTLDIRGSNSEYRPRSTVLFHEPRPTSGQEFKLPGRQETVRPPSREFKPSYGDTRPSQEIIVAASAAAASATSSAAQTQQHVEPLRRVNEPRPAGRDSRMTNDGRGQDISRPCFEGQIHEQPSRLQKVETRNPDRINVKRVDMEINKHSVADHGVNKHAVARKMVVGGPGFRSPSPPGSTPKPQAEFLQPSSGPAPNYLSVAEDGRSVCGICNKVFSKPSQLRLHINIHYFERPFRCESCAVSFRTKGHLTKHERSVSHHNKVSMTSTFGAATTSNPRPFKCTDCKIAFRIHGHLAKHLRSKMHIMKLECLGKLPFGTYAEMERSGVNLNDIDTTDCDNSLTSLQILAQKLYEKDPSKMGQWDAEIMPHQSGASGGETSSDEGEPIPPHSFHQYPQPINTEIETSRETYETPILVGAEAKAIDDPRRNVNSRFAQQPIAELNRSNDSLADHRPNDVSSHPYKCHICAISMRTVNELKVHRFVEHNVESSVYENQKDNPQTRMSAEELRLVRVDEGPRRKSDDS